jgi:uncharacterized membrane protein
MRLLVSWVLLAGVSLAAALIAVGLAASFVAGWTGSLLGRPVADTPAASFAGLGEGLLALRPMAISQLGLLVLLATPIVRVATSLVAFALERDGRYVAITAVVLAILLASALLIR